MYNVLLLLLGAVVLLVLPAIVVLGRITIPGSVLAIVGAGGLVSMRSPNAVTI